MFSNAYQNGNYLEVFDAKASKEKEKIFQNLMKVINAANFKKIFDKNIKSYVYEIDSSKSKLQLPKDDKQELALIQHYLVFQIYIPQGQPFSLEIVVTDTGKNKRRLNFTSNVKDIDKNYFHVKIPIDILKKGVWLNLRYTFRSIDMISIGGICNLRRIFTMKYPINDSYQIEEIADNENTVNNFHIEGCLLPKVFSFPPGVFYQNQLIQYTSISQWQQQTFGSGGVVEDSQNSLDKNSTTQYTKSSNYTVSNTFKTKFQIQPELKISTKTSSFKKIINDKTVSQHKLKIKENNFVSEKDDVLQFRELQSKSPQYQQRLTELTKEQRSLSPLVYRDTHTKISNQVKNGNNFYIKQEGTKTTKNAKIQENFAEDNEDTQISNEDDVQLDKDHINKFKFNNKIKQQNNNTNSTKNSVNPWQLKLENNKINNHKKIPKQQQQQETQTKLKNSKPRDNSSKRSSKQKDIQQNISSKNGVNQQNINNKKSKNKLQEKVSEDEEYKNYCSEVSKFNTITDPNLLMVPEDIIQEQSKSGKYRGDEEIEEEIEEEQEQQYKGNKIYQDSKKLEDKHIGMYQDLIQNNSPEISRKTREDESRDNFSIVEEHMKDLRNTRPFTPPFNTIVKLESNQTLITKQSGKDEKILIQPSKQQLVEVIYDAILNCYYDPKTQEYYQLKS